MLTEAEEIVRATGLNSGALDGPRPELPEGGRLEGGGRHRCRQVGRRGCTAREVPQALMAWRLLVAPAAERTLARLPERVAAAVVEFMIRPLLEERRRVGKPLQRELAGYWSARRGAYRVVYRLDDEARAVRVVRIDHRADVYRQG